MLPCCTTMESWQKTLHPPFLNPFSSPGKLFHPPLFHSRQIRVSEKLYCHPNILNSSATRRKKKNKYGGSIPILLRALETQNDVEKTLNSYVGKLTPKEQTILLKEQHDWRSALRVFQWIKSQEDYVPNVIHYNVLLRILGRVQKWDELRLCWIQMAKDCVFPTNNTYGMLIDVYGKAGLVHESLLWLKHMKLRGIFPDEVTMNTAVRVLKDAGEFDRADKLFKDWCTGLVEVESLDVDPLDLDLGVSPISLKHFLSTELFKSGGRVPPLHSSLAKEQGSIQKPQRAATYNTLIDLYGKAGRLKDASNAFGEMLRSGVAPDTTTFNTMMHICGTHGLLFEAESLLGKMEEKRVLPDTKTYNIFMSLYGDAGNIDAVLKCYRKIKEEGLYPDVITHRIVLQTLCERKMVEEVENIIDEMERSDIYVDQQSLPVVMEMYIEEGLLEKAKKFFEKYCTRKLISSKNYAAIIDAYAEKGLWAEAEAIFLQKRDLGYKTEVIEYNVMIKAYGKAKLYDKALSLFGRMRSSGTWPDECTYNSLIQMLSGGELHDHARDLLAKMLEAGFKPRCATFSTIIASFSRADRISEAVEVYQEMVRVGVEPNEIVYGSLINAFAEVGKVKEALYYFHLMKEFGITPNQIVFTSLIKAYSKVGLWNEAQEIYGKMRDLEGGPDVIASNCMINLYANLGMVHEAHSIFNTMQEKGLADGVSFATMMYLYKNMGMLDEAMNLAHEMKVSGLLTDCASFNNVMTSYATSGQLKEYGELMHQMINRKILPDSTSFKVMLIVLKKAGMPMEAVAQLQTAYDDGKPYARQAIITSVFSVVGLHAFALESCETFTKAEIGLDSYVYNVAIHAYGASGEVEKALNMYMRMQDEGIEADLVTCINLVVCYGKAGLVEGVKRIYSQLNYGEIELNESLFKAIIDAFKEVGRHDLAKLTDQEMRFSFQEKADTDSDNSNSESE